MASIRAPSDLKAHCRLKALEPFGIEISPRDEMPLGELSAELLDRMARSEKLVLLRGFSEPSREELLGYCREYPSPGLLEWDFGPVMEMKVRPDPANYLFSTEKVPFHWDGAFHKEPSYLFFHCLEAPSAKAGGETLFTDAERVWETASSEERLRWERVRLTYRTEKLAHYGGTITVPLVQKHPKKESRLVKFAEPVETAKNPVSLEVSGVPVPERESLVARLSERLYRDDVCYRHAWRDGDMLIADNHALLHGRNAFRESSPRHLRRIQIL